ncbi:hypothetical protein PENSTE_c005G08021 [Penicillium steckii]|uniref:Uncharacterized protein n=1 Tax=Penicillium steckii TaxID=303698 RepID=A0A1V6TKZ6_9EURO|nr:hypothetical protein PENSTE_c005G08021 [Penicillium steckii]
MTSTAVFYEQSQSYNWLDAISNNKSFFDPRTIETHQDTVVSLQKQEAISLSEKAIATLPAVNQRVFMTKWIRQIPPDQKQSKIPADLVDITNSFNIDPSDMDIQRENYSDIASTSSSTVCTSIDKDFLESWQIEAVPSYPKQPASNNTLFDLRNQICHPVSPKNVPVQTVSPYFAENNHMYSPLHHIEMTSMTSQVCLPSDFTDSTLYGSSEDLNICKLIVGKMRQAAVHSAGVFKKLKCKLKH